MLVFRDVTYCFHRARAITSANFEFDHGLTLLVGANGCGKTTTLRLAATVLKPQRGQVEVLGVSTSSGSQIRDVRRKIGYMPQQTPQLAVTVEEWIEYGAWLSRVPARDRRNKVNAAIRLLDLASLQRRSIGSLSGGERKRADLARALVGDPIVLLLDEPTAGLDAQATEVVASAVRGRPENALTLIATHDDRLPPLLGTVRVHSMTEG